MNDTAENDAVDPQAETEAPFVAPEGARVLVIETDLLVGRLIKSKMTRWGYKTVLDNGANGALALYRTEVFRIVVVGAKPQGMSGPELIRALRAIPRPSYTYIVFVGTAEDKDATIAALDAGADEVLTKPLNAREFALRLRKAERLLSLADRLSTGGGTETATGVLNRAAFAQFLRATLAHYTRAGKGGGTLLFVTIDNEHDIYAQSGYETVLEVHKALVQSVVPGLRSSDLFAHLGAGRFCLLLHDAPMENSRIVADRLLATIGGELAVDIADGTVYGSLAFTATPFPQGELTADQILDEAPLTVIETAPAASFAKADTAIPPRV